MTGICLRSMLNRFQTNLFESSSRDNIFYLFVVNPRVGLVAQYFRYDDIKPLVSSELDQSKNVDESIGIVVYWCIRTKMERWLGKVAIVTGASGGIGADIAEALVRAGIKVVGVARRVEKIQNLAAKFVGHKGVLHPMECDVRKEEDILRVFEWTENTLGGVDILVNNAAVLVSGSIIDGSTENYRKIMEVNVIAVAIFTREAVNSMRKRNVPGHIININSVAGHDAKIIRAPANLYAASKFAVTAMTASVKIELAAAKMNVKVTSISPGAVKTDMLNSLGLSAEIIERNPSLAGKDIAEAVIYVLATPPHVQVDEVTVTPVATMSS